MRPWLVPLMLSARLLQRWLWAGPAWRWSAVLAAGMPWVKLAGGGAAFYPLHVVLGLLALPATAGRGGAVRAGLRPAGGALVLLGAYLALVAALRGDWPLAALLAGATLANGCWGWAARTVGHGSDAPALPEALILWLALAPVLGGLMWAAAAWWPAACGMLPCRPRTVAPWPFAGGWGDPALYLLFLLLLLPALWTPLLALNRLGRPGGGLVVLLAVVGLGALLALPGGRLWYAVPLGAAWAGLWLVAGREGHAQDRLLLKGAGVLYLWAAVVLYGVSPGYLGMLFAGDPAEGIALRVEQEVPTGGLLSSETPTPLTLEVVNPGPFDLALDAGQRVWVAPRLLIRPGGGETRAYPLARVALPGSLPAGERVALTVPLLLPPWASTGFLAWHFEAEGLAAPRLGPRSAVGFRFRNPAFRDLKDSEDNLLTALAARSRTMARQALPPHATRRDLHGAEAMLGDVLDTLVFSPLWGQPAPYPKTAPFGGPRPFWLQLLAEYGLIGLMLALAAGWGLARRAGQLAYAARAGTPRLAWSLVVLAVGVIALTGFFSPVLGTYHGQWGLFLLFGFTEGRHDRFFLRAGRPGGGGNALGRLWAALRARLAVRRRRRPPRTRRRRR